ncbi:MAG: hypothetical protein E7613_02110 [Ruminococcaceae bacterium]|nr:hypothetical protein [Oscillospiraceae bacterium]
MKKAIKKTKFKVSDKIMWGLSLMPLFGMAMLASADGVTKFFGMLFVLLGLSVWALNCARD